MNTIVRALNGMLLVFALLLAAVFAQSYTGRRDVVNSQRQSCLGFGRTVLVPLLNVLRADEEANRAVAADPRQPAETRRARRAQALLEERSLQYMDERVDASLVGLLNPTGRRIVQGFVQQGRAFSCEKAYPAASPFRFFG